MSLGTFGFVGASPAHAAEHQVTGGDMTWGVKQSFRSYIAGPIAHGSVSGSGGARVSGGVPTFTKASGRVGDDGSASLSFVGTVRYQGHSGELDFTLSNPRITTNAGGSGTLAITYKPAGKAARTLTMASLAPGSVKVSGTIATMSGRGTTLTEAGRAVFAYNGNPFYAAGTALDPVSSRLQVKASSTPSSPSPSTPAPKPTTPSAPKPSNSSPKPGGSQPGPQTSAPKAPSGGNASSVPASAGSLSWGVRSSFRSYVLGPIAHGSIATSGGASNSGGAFVFPQNGGPAGSGANYRGAVTFKGHGGTLNMTMSSPSVSVSGNSGTLSVTVNGKRTTIATLNLAAATKSSRSGATTYTGAPATLTAAGSSLFSYKGSSFYPAGSAMDPVTFTVGSPSTKSGGSSTVTSGGSGSSSSGGSSSDSGNSANSGESTDGKSSSDSSASKSAASSKTPETACRATGKQLTWGIKESFRSYISGSIANGSWKASGGASYTTPSFVWASGTGAFDQKSRKGNVSFPGTVHFTGHDGALDTTMTNPEITLDGDKAYLALDFTSTSMDAALEGRSERSTRKGVRFVEIDLKGSKLEKKGANSVLTVKNAATTLTADGAKSFSNYPKGTAFDPIAFEITAASTCLKKGAAGGSSEASPSASPSKSSAAQAANLPATERSDSGNGSWWVGAGAIGLATLVGTAVFAARRAGAGS